MLEIWVVYLDLELTDSGVLIYRQGYGIKFVMCGHGHVVYHMAYGTPKKSDGWGHDCISICVCEFTVLNVFICPFVETVSLYERSGEDEIVMEENGFRLVFI